MTEHGLPLDSVVGCEDNGPRDSVVPQWCYHHPRREKTLSRQDRRESFLLAKKAKRREAWRVDWIEPFASDTRMSENNNLLLPRGVENSDIVDVDNDFS